VGGDLEEFTAGHVVLVPRNSSAIFFSYLAKDGKEYLTTGKTSVPEGRGIF